jgi:hypothetical protein
VFEKGRDGLFGGGTAFALNAGLDLANNLRSHIEE